MNSLSFIIGAAIALVAVSIALSIWWANLEKRSKRLENIRWALDRKEERFKNEYAAFDADRKTLGEQIKEILPFLNCERAELSASYAVSESDAMKFNTLYAIKKNARKKLTFNLANDIIKKFPEPKYKDGVYSYKFKIMEVE